MCPLEPAQWRLSRLCFSVKAPLIIAAFHSVSFIYLSAFPVLEWMSVFVGALLCPKQPAVSRERDKPFCCLLRVALRHSCLQHPRGAAAHLLPAPLLPSSCLGLSERLLCLVLCWCYLGCFQEQCRTASSVPKTDTENENYSRIIFSCVKVQLKQYC